MRAQWHHAVWAALAIAPLALAEGPDAAPAKPAGAVSAPAESVLERRIRLLAHELELDAGQQVSVRRTLEDQRVAVRAVLSDVRLLPAERGPAISAIQERTADQIRSILTEEQKQKYNKPRHSSSGSERPDVQTWLDVASGKRPPPGPSLPRRAIGRWS